MLIRGAAGPSEILVDAAAAPYRFPLTCYDEQRTTIMLDPVDAVVLAPGITTSCAKSRGSSDDPGLGKTITMIPILRTRGLRSAPPPGYEARNGMYFVNVATASSGRGSMSWFRRAIMGQNSIAAARSSPDCRQLQLE